MTTELIAVDPRTGMVSWGADPQWALLVQQVAHQLHPEPSVLTEPAATADPLDRLEMQASHEEVSRQAQQVQRLNASTLDTVLSGWAEGCAVRLDQDEAWSVAQSLNGLYVSLRMHQMQLEGSQTRPGDPAPVDWDAELAALLGQPDDTAGVQDLVDVSADDQLGWDPLVLLLAVAAEQMGQVAFPELGTD